jgi:hypothetical protein
LYFSGFSLINEKELFADYIIENDFTISGFSYGAQKAFEYVLNTNNRIDLLQLFSPSYFNDKDIKYKRMQLIYFKKDALKYCNNFLENCGLAYEKNKYFKIGIYEELIDLLNYKWDKKKFQKIIDKNINIEIYLGKEDKIVDTTKAVEFFKEFGEVYYMEDKEHIL